MSDQNQIGSPLPAYVGTVFVSYARADDEKPPFSSASKGWVTFFWECLRWALINQGVHQAKLWLDRYQIEPAEDITEKLEAALQEARIFIPIVSPNWVQRRWCREEIDRFVALHTADGVVPVIKLQPPLDDLPPSLRNREGYAFFVKEPTGEVREFYYDDLEDKEGYRKLIRRIAEWIAARLISSSSIKATAPARTGRVIYLAAAADELRDARQRIANDLEGAGYVVCPFAALPDTKAEAEAHIREGLARSVFSVHLIGDRSGVRPADSDEGIVPLQLRIARELSERTALPRLLWVPKWLPGSNQDKDKKRDPFEVIKRFGPLREGEEVYAEEATDLSQMLRSRLSAAQTPGPRVVHLLVAAAAAEDDGLIGPLGNRLQSDQIKVKLRFSDDPEPLGDLGQMTRVLVFWDKATPASISVLLDALFAKNAKVAVFYLAGDNLAAKQRLFRDGVYVDQLAEIPADRRAARALLERLEIALPGSAPDIKS